MSLGILGTGLRTPAADTRKVTPIGDEADPKTKRLPRIDRLAIAVAREALGSHGTEGLGLVVGTSWGGLAATVDFLEGLAARGPAFGSPTAFHESVHHAPGGQLSILLGITGPSLTLSSRELSGEAGLRAGLDLVASGRCARVLVVCADELVAALDAAHRALRSPLQPAEGAAAVLLGPGPAKVALEEVRLGSRPAGMLRPADGAELAALNGGCAGLMAAVRAARALEEAAPGSTEVLRSAALGGGEATVSLRRTAA